MMKTPTGSMLRDQAVRGARTAAGAARRAMAAARPDAHALRTRLIAVLAALLMVLGVAAPAPASSPYVDKGTSAAVSGSNVTMKAVVSTTRAPHAVDVYKVCVRDSAGVNRDLPSTYNAVITKKGTTYQKTASFSNGTYTYWSCVKENGTWYNLSPKKTFTVGTTTGSEVGANADFVGLSIPFNYLTKQSDARLAELLTMTRDAGATWVRIDVAATALEGSQGRTNWAPLDRVVTAADAKGLKILGVVNTLPAWVQTHGWNTGPRTQVQRDAYTDFARRAAERYAPTIDAWELWNEPNLDQFWNPTPSVSDYAALIRQAYPAVKKADPSSPVIAGGTGWAGGSPEIESADWYSALYASGVKSYFDAVTVHPYPDVYWSRKGQHFTGGEMGPVVDIRTTMNAYGDSGKAIWGTEVGYPTAGSGSVTETEQADWLPIVQEGWVDQTTGRGKTGPLFWYTLIDSNSTTKSGSFGILRTDSTKKPAYHTLRDWVRQ